MSTMGKNKRIPAAIIKTMDVNDENTTFKVNQATPKMKRKRQNSKSTSSTGIKSKKINVSSSSTSTTITAVEVEESEEEIEINDGAGAAASDSFPFDALQEELNDIILHQEDDMDDEVEEGKEKE
jgi:hypothetical protein